MATIVRNNAITGPGDDLLLVDASGHSIRSASQRRGSSLALEFEYELENARTIKKEAVIVG